MSFTIVLYRYIRVISILFLKKLLFDIDTSLPFLTFLLLCHCFFLSFFLSSFLFFLSYFLSFFLPFFLLLFHFFFLLSFILPSLFLSFSHDFILSSSVPYSGSERERASRILELSNILFRNNFTRG
jgi:hypothetical protein